MRYNPKQANPQDWEALKRYIEEELRQIALTFKHLDSETMTLAELHVAPIKPQEGICAYADGTDWNPGAGTGLYQYRNGSWVKVG